MSDTNREKPELQTLPYPNGFVFGALLGIAMTMHKRNFGRLAYNYRPQDYLINSLTGGLLVSYYDMWRRRQIDKAVLSD